MYKSAAAAAFKCKLEGFLFSMGGLVEDKHVSQQQQQQQSINI